MTKLQIEIERWEKITHCWPVQLREGESLGRPIVYPSVPYKFQWEYTGHPGERWANMALREGMSGRPLPPVTLQSRPR